MFELKRPSFPELAAGRLTGAAIKAIIQQQSPAARLFTRINSFELSLPNLDSPFRRRRFTAHFAPRKQDVFRWKLQKGLWGAVSRAKPLRAVVEGADGENPARAKV